MDEYHDRPGQEGSGRAKSIPDDFDWSRLLSKDSVKSATEEIRRMLSPEQPADELCEEEDPVVGALTVWRAARQELTRVEQRLEARTRELGLLQTLGRKAAEAHTVQDLLRIAAETLQESLQVEMILVVRFDESHPRAECFLVRPAEPAVLAEIARASGEFIGRTIQEGQEVQVRKLGSWDESHWPLRSVRQQDQVMLPILRRGTAVACLTMVHSSPPREDRLRILHGAANQLSTHMDRILTLREAEEDRFRSILECMPQAVLLFDTEFHPVHVNPAARILLEQFGLGDSAEPVRMLNGLDLTAMAEQALENGGSSDSELRLPLGETWNVTASPVCAEPGRTDGWVFVFTDLTESRRLQDQLAQAEKMSSLGQMISGVAHELNNPLASIIGYAQLLQAAPPDTRAELAGRLEIMDQEARRCQKIVRNLLSFARRRDPEKKLFALNDLVQSVQSLMRYQLRMDDVEIVPDTDLELPLLYGDAHLIQQVLLNLVTNSHHALKEKGEGGRIWIRTVKAGEDILLLEVEDDGPGIPPAIRSRIFDPFFTTKGPGEGTGLGLSLVYGTVTSHGGTVECRESDRGGVCFRIRLPRAEPDDGGTEKKEQDLSVSPPDRARVLVVDDERVVADLMKAMLQQEGHQVVTAASGREALDLLARETFSMVIIDYRMPGISGVRLCEEIRAKMGDTPLPMLMTSGDTISGEPEQVAARVGVPLLHKPFNMDEFHGAVRRRLHEQASGKL